MEGGLNEIVAALRVGAVFAEHVEGEHESQAADLGHPAQLRGELVKTDSQLVAAGGGVRPVFTFD